MLHGLTANQLSKGCLAYFLVGTETLNSIPIYRKRKNRETGVYTLIPSETYTETVAPRKLGIRLFASKREVKTGLDHLLMAETSKI